MRQVFGSFGSLFAAACCLGVAPLLSVLTAAGAGFLINDAILIPLFILFLGFTLWSLNLSRKKHNIRMLFYIGLSGSIIAFGSLWIFAPLSWFGLAMLISASVWDLLLIRKYDTQCETK